MWRFGTALQSDGLFRLLERSFTNSLVDSPSERDATSVYSSNSVELRSNILLFHISFFLCIIFIPFFFFYLVIASLDPHEKTVRSQ